LQRRFHRVRSWWRGLGEGATHGCSDRLDSLLPQDGIQGDNLSATTP